MLINLNIDDRCRFGDTKYTRFVGLCGCAVPEVHTVLLTLISVLRRLAGQVICLLAEARKRHLIPGLVCSNLHN